jgi:hypothetical protein
MTFQEAYSGTFPVGPDPFWFKNAEDSLAIQFRIQRFCQRFVGCSQSESRI